MHCVHPPSAFALAPPGARRPRPVGPRETTSTLHNPLTHSTAVFSTGDLLSGTITCVCMLSSFVTQGEVSGRYVVGRGRGCSDCFTITRNFQPKPFSRPPPTAWRTPQGVEHSDQILSTRLTRGPRRPKRHVMGSQGHGDHPADTSVRKVWVRNLHDAVASQSCRG